MNSVARYLGNSVLMASAAERPNVYSLPSQPVVPAPEERNVYASARIALLRSVEHFFSHGSINISSLRDVTWEPYQRTTTLLPVTLVILIALLFPPTPIIKKAPPVAAPAFPGAEGFGANTPGGRGGKVIAVTNLSDDGPGSFRAACETEGPRIVIFRVSGLITLNRKLVIKNPYITIAGQTAPGDGICLRNYTFVIATHDVVVRYLRSRLGDVTAQEDDSLTLAAGAKNVVVDHCSATWSVDEDLSLAGDVSNVTVQWCLIAEGLHHSKHSKGAHGYGSLSRAKGPVTWHHNLWAHNVSRNPRLGDNYGRPPYPTFDVRNNVIYDYGEIASGLTQGVLKVNYVANFIRPGPSSMATTPIHVGGPSDLSFYIKDNIF